MGSFSFFRGRDAEPRRDEPRRDDGEMRDDDLEAVVGRSGGVTGSVTTQTPFAPPAPDDDGLLPPTI